MGKFVSSLFSGFFGVVFDFDWFGKTFGFGVTDIGLHRWGVFIPLVVGLFYGLVSVK